MKYVKSFLLMLFMLFYLSCENNEIILPKEIKVEKINAQGGTITIQPQKSIYYEGDTLTITATPDWSYSFKNWVGNVVGTNNSIQIKLSQDISIQAL